MKNSLFTYENNKTINKSEIKNDDGVLPLSFRENKFVIKVIKKVVSKLGNDGWNSLREAWTKGFNSQLDIIYSQNKRPTNLLQFANEDFSKHFFHMIVDSKYVNYLTRRKFYKIVFVKHPGMFIEWPFMPTSFKSVI